MEAEHAPFWMIADAFPFAAMPETAYPPANTINQVGN
jgi:hypothetical protein